MDIYKVNEMLGYSIPKWSGGRITELQWRGHDRVR